MQRKVGVHIGRILVPDWRIAVRVADVRCRCSLPMSTWGAPSTHRGQRDSVEFSTPLISSPHNSRQVPRTQSAPRTPVPPVEKLTPSSAQHGTERARVSRTRHGTAVACLSRSAHSCQLLDSVEFPTAICDLRLAIRQCQFSDRRCARRVSDSGIPDSETRRAHSG